MKLNSLYAAVLYDGKVQVHAVSANVRFGGAEFK
jgi:hypothetical protein